MALRVALVVCALMCNGCVLHEDDKLMLRTIVFRC